ncbi:hypothetical protein ACKKBG_A23945 [Auxenochlorella protothecoides x Auxenochlorella symbiontica]
MEECRSTHAQIASLEASNLEGRRSAAAQQSMSMQQQLTSAQASLSQARVTQAKAQKDLQSLDSGLRPSNWFASSAKKEGRAQAGQAALDAANATVRQAEGVVADMQSSLAHAQSEEAQLNGQAALLQSLRARRASLLEAISQSPSFAAHPGMASLSAAIAAARADAAQNAGWAAQYATADAGLRRALSLLQAALQSLSGARRVGTVGLVQDVRRRRRTGTSRGGPITGDVIQMVQVRRANGMVSQAANEILRVHAALPTLPYVEPALLRNASAGIFANMLVSSLATQVLSQSRIVGSLREVERMEGQVSQCAGWTKANADAFRGREAAALSTLAAKTAELEALRLSLLPAN